jgi:hypothetical protein
MLLLSQDSPEQGVLYLLRLLLDKIKEIQFDPTQVGQATIYLNILDMLCWCAQDTFPYHLQNVVSNDQLYGADPKFINEINEIATGIMEELLIMMKALGDNVKLQCTIAIELFERVAIKADLRDDKILQLALNLWNLTVKNRQVMEPKVHQKMLHHLKSVKSLSRNKDYRLRMDELIRGSKL